MADAHLSTDDLDPREVFRFLGFVEKTPDGCWFWTAARDKDGYAWFKDGRSWRAARWAYEVFRGRIPEGLQIDHLCRNKGCVNPFHLEPVTCQVNIQRQRAAREKCFNGHTLAGENLLPPSTSGRTCRQCRLDSRRRAYKRRDEAVRVYAAEYARVLRAGVPKGQRPTLAEIRRRLEGPWPVENAA